MRIPIGKEDCMATAKPPRKTATQPTAPALAKGHTSASAATGRPEAPAKQREPETSARTDQASRPTSAHLVADVRSGLGVTRELFARLTGFSVRAITDWEAGRPISEAGLRRVKEMERLRAALAEGLRGEFIRQWLETPCDGLGGLKPVEVLERGETDRLWKVVLMIGSGMPT
jgi:DNA-binding transcriptional regulator YiaG